MKKAAKKYVIFFDGYYKDKPDKPVFFATLDGPKFAESIKDALLFNSSGDAALNVRHLRMLFEKHKPKIKFETAVVVSK